MPTVRRPRKGSLQFWHRRRSKRNFARVRSWIQSNQAKPLGFAGYKVGMTHLIIHDNKKAFIKKNIEIFCPATIIECPPLKTVSIRFYKNTSDGLKVVSETYAENLDKDLERSIILPKKPKKNELPSDFDFVRLLVHTQPRLTGIGKKKPEVFEIAVGGKKEEQLNYAKSKLGKEINISEVFKEGQQLDVHAVSKGKGVQGPVRRFGITLKGHKTEKSRRNPGSLGGWKSQGHIMWRVAKAGKMGYHPRTELNKQLLKIGAANEIGKNGFEHYGIVKNSYILLKGSVIGSKKRLIRICESTRPDYHIADTAPAIKYTNLA
jgi:large subunit ribosomal protein L3